MEIEENFHNWLPNEILNLNLDFNDLNPYSTQIMNFIQLNQVSIIDTNHFSSKTYFIPHLLYNSYLNNNGWKIGIVFPNINYALTRGKLLCDFFGLNYLTDINLFWNSLIKNNIINIYTPESLINEFKKSLILNSTEISLSAIYFDSYFDSNLDGEICISLLKNLIKSRLEFRLIIGISYHENLNYLLNYFNNNEKIQYANFLSINYQNNNIKINHLTSFPNDLFEEIISLILEIHKNKEDCNILIFLSCFDECEKLSKILINLKIQNLLIINQNSKINNLNRLVYFATTLNQLDRSYQNIKFVIDSGFKLIPEYNFQKKWTYIIPTFINIEEANSRSLISSNNSGITYRLYPQINFNENLNLNYNFNLIFLKLLYLKIFNLKNFNFFKKFLINNISKCLELFYFYGILDKFGKLTFNISEKYLNLFGLPISYIKMLLTSFEYGCTEEIITIITMLTFPIKYNYGIYQINESDLLSMLNYFSKFISSENEKMNSLIKNYRYLLKEKCKLIGNIFSNQNQNNIIKCIISGFFLNCAKFDINTQNFNHLITNEILYIHPNSILNNYEISLNEFYIIFTSIEFKEKPFMKNITIINEPEFLLNYLSKMKF